MSYKPPDLKTQLAMFAAKQIVSKVIHTAGNEAVRSVKSGMQARRVKRAVIPKPQKKKEYHEMSFTDETTTAPTRSASRNAGSDPSYRKDDPVEVWVNTVLVREQGGEPIRILGGRPITAFKANKDVNTSNDDFNRANAISNAFVRMLQQDADGMELGQSRYYSPQGAPMNEDGTPNLAPGIYFQLHRTMVDPAADAATKADLEAQATSELRNLFG